MIPASRALDSDRRRIARLRVGVATAGALLAASVVVGSAATLGGFHSESIGAASDDARSITTAQLEWNPEADDASPFPRAVRLSTGAGESFQRDDMVSITAAGQGNDTCSAKAVVTRDGSRVLDVPFAACGVPLWELNGVEVTVSGPAGGRALKTNVGALSGALASFDGDVVRPANDTTAGYTTVGSGADASVATLRLAVRDASVEQLVGTRLMAMVSTTQQEPTPYTGTIGTRASNEGIWVEQDLQDPAPTIVADLRALTDGRAPQVADVAQYRLVVLQPQHLGAEQSPATRYAVATADGTMDTSGGDAVVDVSTALEPVGLDDRLQFTVIQRDEQTIPKLSFCYDFRVTNTSTTPVDWQLTFDTTKQPLWGMNPTLGRFSGAVGLKDLWGGQTTSFDVESGLWTISGQPENTTIPAATGKEQSYVDVGYCAQPPVPPVNRNAFTAPTFSVESGSDRENVELRVKLSSASQFLVPWEGEIDFADHVCASTLPNRISAERATLTRIEGTRYLVQGKDADTMFVSENRPQDFIFARYSPGGRPFELGKC